MPQPSMPAVNDDVDGEREPGRVRTLDGLDRGQGLAGDQVDHADDRRAATSRRRVATDTAASTAGPAASPENVDSAPVTTATAIGQRRRKKTST